MMMNMSKVKEHADRGLVGGVLNHRLNGTSSPVLTATSLSYGPGIQKFDPPQSKPLAPLR